MEFRKQLMSISELVEEVGFSEYNLRKLAQEQGYPLVIRESTGKNGKMKIDTTVLQKFLARQSQMMERR